MPEELKKLYGRSLSLCVMDILAGRVKEEQVEVIVSSTALRDQADLDRCKEVYSRTYWEDNPEQASEIVQRLWDARKVVQPRLEDDRNYQHLACVGIWADTEGEAYATLKVWGSDE